MLACNDTRIFVEVKRPGWQGELAEEQRSRKMLPKYFGGEARWLDNTKPIREVVEHAVEQCPGTVPSLCVVADDLWIGPQREKLSSEIALFSPKHPGHESGYLAHDGAFVKSENAALGGVMFVWPEAPDTKCMTLALGRRLYLNPNAIADARLPAPFAEAYRGVDVPDYQP